MVCQGCHLRAKLKKALINFLEIRLLNHNMVFASPSSTTSKPVIAMQSNSHCNLGPESGQQKSTTLSRHARHAEQHDDDAHSLPPLQSSFQTVYGTNLSLGFPSSWSAPNVSHTSRSLDDVKNGEHYPSSALSSTVEPQSPPLTDNDFHTSVTSNNEVSSFHSKNHAVLSSILDLKRLNPAIILQNSGSVARDHLASERTFLAYVHTSLALSSAGVGIVQLLTIADSMYPKSSEIPTLDASRRMKRIAKPLGILTQVLALYVLFLGQWCILHFFFVPGFVNGECLGLIPLVFSFCFFLSLYMTKLTVNTSRCVQVFRGPAFPSQKHVPSGKIVHCIPLVRLRGVGCRCFLGNLDELSNPWNKTLDFLVFHKAPARSSLGKQ